MISYRSGNPALSKQTFKNVTSRHSDDVMTLDGTVNKTALSLLILLFSSVFLLLNGYYVEYEINYSLFVSKILL